MFRIIQAVRPDYIIGENVPGLLSIEGGVVFEQVCLDLESEGYEVQAFVLPACATGAPHRRDRVWIVGYTTSNGHSGRYSETGGEKRESEQRGLLKSTGANSGITSDTEQKRCGGWCDTNSITEEREIHQNFGHNWNGIRSEIEGCGECTSENPGSSGCNDGEYEQQGSIGNFRELGTGGNEWDVVNANGGNYWHDWPSISPFHSGHDGLSTELVRHIRTSLAEAGETPENIEAYIRKESNYIRKESIKCAGNAVVPTVVLQIMKAIQYHYENTND